jgi:major type 1 subunit fimbrin (pilin)
MRTAIDRIDSLIRAFIFLIDTLMRIFLMEILILRKARIIALLLIFCGLSGLTVSASAASCNASGGNFSVAVGSRTIPRDAGVGQVVISKIGTSSPYRMDCTGDSAQDRDAYVKFTVASPPVAGYPDVYPTNIPGLGAKYHFATNSGAGCNIPFDQTIQNSAYSITCHILAGTTLSWSWGTSVEFIKTGPIGAGTLTSVPAVTMSYSLNNQSGTWPLNNMYSGSASGIIGVGACLTPDVTVNLGTHDSKEFSGVGSAASATAFSIALNNCPSGIGSVKYQVDAVTTVVDASRSVVALTSTSTATGVGLQVLDNTGNALPLGQLIAFAGYKSNGGNFTIPLKARYYQTASRVTGGTANSSMTFTITYQ